MRVGDGLTIGQGRLRITGIDGMVKVRWHRPLPEGARLGHAVISRNGGHRHACFAVELRDTKVVRSDFTPVGIDVGITHLAALSAGQAIANPKWTREADAKLRRLS